MPSVVVKTLLLQMMCYDLMSIEDLYNDSPDAEDTNDINEESVSVPTTNDIGLAHLGDTLLLVFLSIFL
jgi:hypothetical protein